MRNICSISFLLTTKLQLTSTPAFNARFTAATQSAFNFSRSSFVASFGTMVCGLYVSGDGAMTPFGQPSDYTWIDQSGISEIEGAHNSHGCVLRPFGRSKAPQCLPCDRRDPFEPRTWSPDCARSRRFASAAQCDRHPGN